MTELGHIKMHIYRFTSSALRTFHSSKTPMVFCQILSAQDSISPTDNGSREPLELNPTSQHGGCISEIAVNEQAQNLLGSVKVTWRLNRNHDNGNQQRNVFLLYS